MNKKRILLTAVALILVCALSIMGTVAFLEAQTNTVTNTFVAAGGPGPFIDKYQDGTYKFEILEYAVTQTSSGKYEQNNASEVKGIEYKGVMPGTTIPKQAFVKLSRSTATLNSAPVDPAPAYLYLEVIDELPEAYSWTVDTAEWALLPGFVGPAGGAVYHYIGGVADDNDVLKVVAEGTKIDILTDDEITVADDAELDAETHALKFNAYLSQASVGESDDPATVFKACFAYTDTTAPDPAP